MIGRTASAIAAAAGLAACGENAKPPPAELVQACVFEDTIVSHDGRLWLRHGRGAGWTGDQLIAKGADLSKVCVAL